MQQVARHGGPAGPFSRLAAGAAAAMIAAGLASAVPAPRSPDVTVLVSVVGSSGSAAEHAVARAVTRLGGAVERQFSLIDGFAARLPGSAVASLSAVPGVRWVSPDSTIHLEGQYGQDSGVASAAYTDVTRASKAWSIGDTGTGVSVAVIDTGVNMTGDLAGQVVHAEDFTTEQNNQDSYGHGTFVAGLIAGNGAGSSGAVKGVAPGAKIVSLKIAGANGLTDVTRVLEALEWVVAFKDVYRIRVVNLSLGFPSHQSYLVDPLDFAVERVWNAGVVVVAAAGNGNNAPGSITAPGNDPFVITAGSSNDKTTVTLDDDQLAGFSSVGHLSDGLSKPDVLAPGQSVVSSRSPGSWIDTTYPSSEIGSRYARGSGTSFSTAITAGAAALVLQRWPLLTPDQVKYRLVSTARAIGGTNSTRARAIDAYGAATSVSLLPANLGVVLGSGGGSLQATRGVLCVRAPDGTCMSDVDVDALLNFDESQYFSNIWAGSLWLGTQWLGSLRPSTLTGSQWAGSQWAGSQWAGSQWAGSQWASAPWAGGTWGYLP